MLYPLVADFATHTTQFTPAHVLCEYTAVNIPGHLPFLPSSPRRSDLHGVAGGPRALTTRQRVWRRYVLR